MKFLLKILITTVNVFVLASILPGIHIADNNIFTAITVAVVLARAQYFYKAIVHFAYVTGNYFNVGFVFVFH